MIDMGPFLAVLGATGLLLSGLVPSSEARAEGETNGNAAFRLTYRIERPGMPVTARPGNGMSAAIVTDLGPRWGAGNAGGEGSTPGVDPARVETS